MILFYRKLTSREYLQIFLESLRFNAWGLGAVLLMGMAGTFLGGLALESRSLVNRHMARESMEISWTVFLRDGAPRDFIEPKLKSMTGVQSVRYISRDEALETVQKDPLLSQSLTLTGRNPFPDSYELRWTPEFLGSEYIESTEAALRAMDGVDHVAFDRPRVMRAGLMVRLRQYMELALAVSFWAAAVALTLLVGRLFFFPARPVPVTLLAGGALVSVLGTLGGWLFLRYFVENPSGASSLVGLFMALLFVLVACTVR
jgi:cell division protein FtsX